MRKKKQIAIYGAQMVAVSVYYAIKTLYPDSKVVSFIVSNREGNPATVDGIPVVELQEFTRKDVKILIAVPENFHAEIRTALEEQNQCDYVCIDSKTEAALMEKYYAKTEEFVTLRSLPVGEKKANLSVYMSKFYKDRMLSGNYAIADFIKPIQAGAALTDIEVADIKDNVGDNISRKNVNYSELSAMYWIGKHAHGDYLGLFHYRRILDVVDEDLYRMTQNDVDVILPYPTVHYPNIKEHHKRYLKESDWQAMLQALHECAPEYAQALPTIFEGQHFYNYNMFIAKEQIFKEYCEWLFPILARTEELSSPMGSERADRYIGYLGENLTTLYFLKNKGRLNVAHTGRLMLI